MQSALTDFNTRFEEMTLTRHAEHQERTKLEADNTALIRLALLLNWIICSYWFYSIYSEVSHVSTNYQ